MNSPSPGSLAPDLRLPSVDGSVVRLSALRGLPVWLGFYRYAACPLCNLRIHEMTERFGARHGRDLHILAVFQSPIAKMRASMAKHDAPFPFLSDPGERSYAEYGVGASLAGFVGAAGPSGMRRLASAAAKGLVGLPGSDGTIGRLPSDFLIDEHGRIEDVFHAREISEHIPFARVDAFLAKRAG